MLRLMLLRHAKTERDAPSGKDRDRRLDERGRRDGAAMAAWMADNDYRPDLALVSTATRTREIGVRMAVGAQRTDIFRMVVGEGLKLSVAGVALGLVSAIWLGRIGSSLLFGVGATDPVTYAGVSLLLIAVALAGCYLPARRAARLDPLKALRYE